MSIPCKRFAYIDAKAKVSRWVRRQSNLIFTVSNEKDHRKNLLSHSFFRSLNEPVGVLTPREDGNEN